MAYIMNFINKKPWPQQKQTGELGVVAFPSVKERLPVFLEAVYNRKRIHSSIGYPTSDVYKKQYADTRSI